MAGPQRRFKHIAPECLFQAVGSERAAYACLAGMFLASTPAQRDAVLAAIALGDCATIAASCHVARGSAVLIGAAGLADMLARCEGQARRHGIAPAASDHLRLTRLFALVLAETARSLAIYGPAAP